MTQRPRVSGGSAEESPLIDETEVSAAGNSSFFVDFNKQPDLDAPYNFDTPSDSPSYAEFSHLPPFKAFIKYSMPNILDELTLAFLPMIDTLYVSHAARHDLAGVSIAGPIEQLAPAIGWLFEQGVAIQISRYAGRGEVSRLTHLIWAAIAASLALSALYCIFASVFLEQILGLLGARGDVMRSALWYARPLVNFGFVFAVDCTLAGIAEGLGRTRLFAFISLLPIITNGCIFNPIFVLWLRLGARGAAVSQIVSQFISAGILIVYFAFFDPTVRPFAFGRFRVNKLEHFDFKRTARELGTLFALGLTDFVAVLSECVSSGLCLIFLERMATSAGLYEDITSMWGVVTRLNVMMISLAAGFNGGYLTVASYALGESDIARFVTLNKLNFVMCIIVCTLSGLLLSVFAWQIFGLFGFKHDWITQIGVDMLRIIAISTPLLPMSYCCASYCQTKENAARGIAISVLAEMISQPLSFALMYYGFMQMFDSQPVVHILVTMGSFTIQDVIGTIVGLACVCRDFHDDARAVRDYASYSIEC